MLEAIWKLFLKILKIVSLVLQPIKYLCFQLWHKFSHLSCLDNLLTYRGCSCSSWVCHRESCLLNRRRMRSLGYNAPAATKASLPQNLASLSLHSCLGKTKNKKTKTKTAGHQIFFFFPFLPSVHPDGFMLYFSAGFEPWLQKGESTVLVNLRNTALTIT